jgi:uncharacterized HAD superfamily protein
MRIGVDLDGVIVDSIAYWIRVLNREAGTNYLPGDLPDTYAAASLAQCSDLHELEMLIAPPPVPGAVAALTHLKALGHQLVVVTSRALRLRVLTMAWLDYHGILVDEIYCLQGGSKAPVAKAQGIDVLVEDIPHQAIAVAESGVPVLLFAAPYNDHVMHQRIERCADWTEVVRQVNGCRQVQ